MKTILPLLLAGALALGNLACKSNPSSASADCICGQPIANMKGCPHEACAHGETNSANPDCVCGSLSIE
jgi:hypothetical protein